MALVFMNLLLGLAVSDIGELVRTFCLASTSGLGTGFCKKSILHFSGANISYAESSCRIPDCRRHGAPDKNDDVSAIFN